MAAKRNGRASNVKVPGGDQEFKPENEIKQSETVQAQKESKRNVPRLEDVCPKKITKPVLTEGGWVVPDSALTGQRIPYAQGRRV